MGELLRGGCATTATGAGRTGAMGGWIGIGANCAVAGAIGGTDAGGAGTG